MAGNWNGFAQVQQSTTRFKPGTSAMLWEYGKALGGDEFDDEAAYKMSQLQLILQRIELAKNKRGLPAAKIREVAGSTVAWSVALERGEFVAVRGPFDVAAVWAAIRPLVQDALFATLPAATGSAPVDPVDPAVAATLKGLCAVLMACGSIKAERLLWANPWGPEDRRLTTAPERILAEVRLRIPLVPAVFDHSGAGSVRT
tara:strand:+ start:2226 stop:2828 length:603 start_codon:yes stop_codon:yes gene_type:complete